MNTKYIILVFIFIYLYLNNTKTVEKLENFEPDNIAKILSSGVWSGPQIFNGGVKINTDDLNFGSNDSGRGKCNNCRALVHGPGNTLIMNYDNDFNGGVEVRSNMMVNNDIEAKGVIKVNDSFINNQGVGIRSGGFLCIGNTCIDEDKLKILNGDKDILIENEYNDNGRKRYLYADVGRTAWGEPDNKYEQKKNNGAIRLKQF